MMNILLSRRQAWWLEFWTRFDDQIINCAGISNGKADSLKRRIGDLSEGPDETLKNMELVVSNVQNLLEELRVLADSPPAWDCPSCTALMPETCVPDLLPGKILEAIWTNSRLKEIPITEYIEEKGRIRYRGKLYVLVNDTLHVQMVLEHHDTTLAGHPGRGTILGLVD